MQRYQVIHPDYRTHLARNPISAESENTAFLHGLRVARYFYFTTMANRKGMDK